MSDSPVLWFLVIGALLMSIALSGSWVKRLPLTTAMLYLGVGALLGPPVLGLIQQHPVENAKLVEHVTEVAVLISLFTAGLKLRAPLRDRRWRTPLRLASVSMSVTIVLLTLVGVAWLGLSLGAAILLGAILAPTDPVLASDVQVEHANDRDRVRFGLTGEAGLNDGVAFPFVMLGLGMLGLHDLGSTGWRWFAIDLVWAVGGGLAIGWLVGFAVTRLVLHVRGVDDTSHAFDDFFTLGLIALAYGLALLAHTYGFLAVFAAGLALRRIERESTSAQDEETTPDGDNETAPTSMQPPGDTPDDTKAAPAQLAAAVLTFNERFERIAEVAVVVLIGSLLTVAVLPATALWFVPLLLLVIRPLAVWIGLRGADVSPTQRRLMGWFGVRGIGSIYYLAFATTHGLTPDLASHLAGLTLAVVATSIVVHGISVTPIMAWYATHTRRRQSAVAKSQVE